MYQIKKKVKVPNRVEIEFCVFNVHNSDFIHYKSNTFFLQNLYIHTVTKFRKIIWKNIEKKYSVLLEYLFK